MSGISVLSGYVSGSSTLLPGEFSDPRFAGYLSQAEGLVRYDEERSGCSLSTTRNPFGEVSSYDDKRLSQVLLHLDGSIGEGLVANQERDPGLVSDEHEASVDVRHGTVTFLCTQLDLEAILGLDKVAVLIKKGMLKLTEVARNVVTGIVEWIAELEARVAVEIGFVDQQLIFPFEGAGRSARGLDVGLMAPIFR